jgi:pimeloyl-ACP methyl ester carboxylesterase
MNANLSLLCALVLSAPPTVECKFAQVAPVPRDGTMSRSKDQARAVLLVHGYRLYPNEESVHLADFRDWQRPGCLLVRELAKDADVFSFGYGQNVGVGVVADSPGLRDAVAQMRKLGYKEIILVGHSAGSIIVRQFVEDHPDAGVTKVVQTCPPNGGASAAGFDSFKNQRAFLDSLTLEVRQQALKDRADKKIPRDVQFVVVLGNAAGESDGLVPCVNQWTPELRKQGVPIVTTKVVHPQVPRTEKGVAAIVDAAKNDHPRWNEERVRMTERMIFGN